MNCSQQSSSFYILPISLLLFLFKYLIFSDLTRSFKNFIFLNGFVSNVSNFSSEPTDNFLMKPRNDNWKEGLSNYYNPRKFYPNASYGFVQYSAYRFSPSQIAIIGVGPTSLRYCHVIGPCIWFGNKGDKIYGKFNYTFDGEMQKTDDEELFICELEKETGDGGGYLVGDLNKEKRIMYEEEAGTLQSANQPFPILHTFCGSPFYGEINGRAVFEWMEYHRVIIGIEYFIFYYVDPLNQTFYNSVKPYLDAKLLKIIPFQEILKFDIWSHGQVTAYLDCMYQVALKSKWVFLHDMDEYLYPVPPHSLSSLLQEHEEKAWMTHGMIEFNIQYCNDVMDDHLFFIERMVYREPRVYCIDDECKDKNFCMRWKGHRKLIVNPRKVFFAAVHSVHLTNHGFNFNASSELRHFHFRLIIAQPSTSYCSNIMKKSDGWWVYDDSLSSTVQKIRSNPIH